MPLPTLEDIDFVGVYMAASHVIDNNPDANWSMLFMAIGKYLGLNIDDSYCYALHLKMVDNPRYIHIATDLDALMLSMLDTLTTIDPKFKHRSWL